MGQGRSSGLHFFSTGTKMKTNKGQDFVDTRRWYRQLRQQSLLVFGCHIWCWENNVVILMFWMCMHQLWIKGMTQGTASIKNQNRYSITFLSTMWKFLRDFNTKLGREEASKLTIGNESVHEHGIRVLVQEILPRQKV